MIRKYTQFVASLLWLFDMALLVVSFALAFFVRSTAFAAFGPVPVAQSFGQLAMAVVIFTLVFRMSGLYRSHRFATRLAEVFSIFQSIALALLLLVASTYFLRPRYSRFTLVLFGLVDFSLMSLTRAVARNLIAEVRRRGHNLRYALVIGAGKLGRTVAQRLEARREYGVKVVGLLARDERRVGRALGGVEVLGTYDDLEQVLGSRQIDQVYIALPLSLHHRVRDLLVTLSTHTADVKVVPDLYQFMTLNGGVEEIDGMPIVALAHGPIHGWDAVGKRAFDLIFGSLMLIGTAPVLLATAVALKLSGTGSVFFAQERMGLDGRTFRLLKFRSMRQDAEQNGAKWATADDARTTRLGRFLRKFSIDELPQVFNILKGEMSLVGPRPERPIFIEAFKKQIPRYNLRHKVKSGLTGLAQVEGWRGSTSVEKRIERDLYYIEHWSLWLDFKILLRTALGGFLSKNAY